MATPRPILLAVTSDHHCGSTVGLCPDEGVRLDDGGNYKPSKAQRWLWSCWQDFWAHVGAEQQRLRAELWILLNGDLGDGDHHNTSQIVSRNPEAQSYIAHRTFGIIQERKPAHLFVVRGTESHAGPSGAFEEAIAQSLGAEQDPDTHTWSWWHLRLAPHGVRIDAQHHGRMGQRPWTETNVVANLAAQIFYEHARRGLPAPALAIRSHHHKFADSYKAHPVRAIQTPAWQLKTSYAHKVVAESLADVGGVLVTITPDGTYEVRERLYAPEFGTTWHP